MAPAPSFEDHYAVLGVTAEANPDEVKAAYRSLSRQFHPDKVAASNDEALQQEHASTMVKINVAFQALYSKLRPGGKENSMSQPNQEPEPRARRPVTFSKASLAPTKPLTVLQRNVIKSLEGSWRNNQGTVLGRIEHGMMNWHKALAADPNTLTMDGDLLALPFEVDGHLLAHRGKIVKSGGVTTICWKNNEFWLGPTVWLQDVRGDQVRKASVRPGLLLASLEDSSWRDAEGTEIGRIKMGHMHWDEALDFSEPSVLSPKEEERHVLVMAMSTPQGPVEHRGSICFSCTDTITWDDGHVWVRKKERALPPGCVPTHGVSTSVKPWNGADETCELVEDESFYKRIFSL
eukprot:TRINITY_DN27379_c0_g1_i1.p1 TRINITY_DN27379_c0_g1~~TRINITY_DN27379_c0_g1_i1.p1  ORF type:complete len:359 (+),score=66.99 TRINITY_DN27379_c0_g1_i1:34-1077(+)